MDERSFPLATFAFAIPLFAGMGYNLDQLAQRAGISPALFTDRKGLITARQYHELVAAAGATHDDPAFALKLARNFGLDMLETLGPLLATAPDMRTMTRDVVRHIALINPCIDLRLEEAGDDAWLYCPLAAGLDLDDRFLHAEALFAIWFRSLRTMLRQPGLQARRICMRHDGSAWLHTYRQQFGADVEVVFNAEDNLIVIDRGILDLPNPGSSPAAYAFLAAAAMEKLAALPTVETFSTTVLRMLEEHTGQRVLDLDELAALMHMNGRTLQRRLREENNSFQKLRDGLRYRQAQAMLREPARDIATIAATLGFSEPTTFYRAFKAWSGQSPSDYRRGATGRPPAGAGTPR